LEEIFEEGEYEQLSTRIFVLRNEFMKKEHEIMNLEAYFKALKKNKGVILDHYTKDEMMLQKVFNCVVTEYREKYCNISKQTITYKNNNKSGTKKINQIKAEVEHIKNPGKDKSIDDTDDRCGVGGDTKTSTPPVKQPLKEDREAKDKADIIRLEAHIEKNKVVLEDLETDIETYKKITFQLEVENAEVNKELTDKLSMIYMLEMKLAKLKNYK
jgi:chromosome segregation ATPase